MAENGTVNGNGSWKTLALNVAITFIGGALGTALMAYLVILGMVNSRFDQQDSSNAKSFDAVSRQIERMDDRISRQLSEHVRDKESHVNRDFRDRVNGLFMRGSKNNP